MQDSDTTALETAVTDGGTDSIIVAGDGAEILDSGEGVDDGRPDDCVCSEFHGETDLACWPCFRQGYQSPPAE